MAQAAEDATEATKLASEETYDGSDPWSLAEATTEDQRPGISAVFRVRSDAPATGVALASLLGVVDEVLVLDTGSAADAMQEVGQVAAANASDTRIRLLSYGPSGGPSGKPSRAGATRRSAAADAVDPTSSEAALNWACSRVACQQTLLWDGSMVASRYGRLLITRVAQRAPTPLTGSFEEVAGYLRMADGAMEVAFDVDRPSVLTYLFPSYPLSTFERRKHPDYLVSAGRSLEAWVASLRLVWLDGHGPGSDTGSSAGPSAGPPAGPPVRGGSRRREVTAEVASGSWEGRFVATDLEAQALQAAFERALRQSILD